MKKTGRKTKGLWIAVLIAAGLAAGRVRGYAAVLVSDSYYDWEDGADDSGRSLSPGSGYTDRDQGSTGGPGVRETQEAEEIITGPQVIQASLTERYHEEYKIYEESIEGPSTDLKTDVGNSQKDGKVGKQSMVSKVFTNMSVL